MSALELEAPDVVNRVRQALDASGVAPELICIEVTESTLVADIELCVERLAALKELGVLLAVDDFGTGYSSLSAVHRYPVDVLKVDRGFLAAIDGDRATRATLGGVVLFARSLELTTLAEGVETPEQAALLEELGYELAQGYWFGRPVTAPVIDRLLQSTHDSCSGLPSGGMGTRPGDRDTD
jgi:EAL domain-containing protein (putative c-di-GMP-specific phosphodiesterase class I)